MVSAAPARGQQSPEVAIRQLMQQQTEAWNQGNIPAFMDTYWRSDSLLFIGKNGVTYGWQATLERYQQSYPDKAAMGTLQFDLLEFKRLNPELYFLVGKWHLQRSLRNVQGHFTLLIRKMNGTWKIIADHSS
ncbi:nuclear transport factor 2 family protein [Chitinophaga japonensis]